MAETNAQPIATDEVRAEIADGIGWITLNRPKQLNALNLPMIRAIRAALEAFEADEAVRLVVFEGAGERGFCAGGDIRALYAAREEPDRATARTFFAEEYAVDHYVLTYAKPVVAFLDGIVMGGGVGLSYGATVKIVTERTRWAMPEAGIGFFPDVGASYFLSRLPHHAGRYLALTGEAVGADVLLRLGLADCFLPSAAWPAVKAALREAGAAGADAPAILTALRERCRRSPGEAGAGPDGGAPAEGAGGGAQDVDGLFERTARYFAGESVPAIVDALEAGAEAGDAWARETLAVLRSRSPTSLFVIFETLRRARTSTYKEALVRDLGVADAFLAHGDFYEGVRAQVVDKDRRPRWRPASLAEVTPEAVAAFFRDPPRPIPFVR
ncbi:MULTISPECIES: enoyl-CoA hydratase/isomerase family protein [Hydrogenibacillus]|uniref:3-hydroxyisobutyryl-CoA hydrolase n=1 Tax=Hydrogenibacillus schlegelii TaxID=1484 RepID=A0A2T5G9X5_HYDSH|nr:MULTISPECIES: enoyl-CoA hydratase/isomerase family protein [Hydrogenibacillus]PTQ52979.1 MAG: 3-hydroxyisobutyryl-CoA hydrolase [Hydrogenibacillus schlegelii]QZA32550.1 enoyl-CoA hydratase/isomerase family protein [Hydrogenibacillus sp. N12]